MGNSPLDPSLKIFLEPPFSSGLIHPLSLSMSPYVTSRSTQHTFIDLFFEDSYVQVIWLSYIMIHFDYGLYMIMMMCCDLLLF
jgi:hypothetical protein